MEGTNRPPLIWAKFTTPDSFEKVWEFYWQKVTKGAPVRLPPNVKSGTLFAGPPGQHTICAYFRDENPSGKVGVLVVREKNQTVSVTIFRRAEEKEASVIVAIDQR